MKRKRYFTVAATSLLASMLFAGSAGAVLVTDVNPPFTEESPGFTVGLGNNEGDNDAVPSQTVAIVNLDLGANMVSGFAFAPGENSDEPQDFDDMILHVQPGQVLTSATFEWTLNEGENAQTQFRLYDGTQSSDPEIPPGGLATAFMGSAVNSGGPIQMFAAALASGLTAGQYLLDQVSIGDFSTGDVDFSYKWTFNVEVVPLPPAVWLFLSGLLAMVGFSRRRQAN